MKKQKKKYPNVRRSYPWAKLDKVGASVTIRPGSHSARAAAYMYAGRRGWSVSCWDTKAGNLIVERVKRR